MQQLEEYRVEIIRYIPGKIENCVKNHIVYCFTKNILIPTWCCIKFIYIVLE